jgi:hypothetical protein
MSRFSRIFIGLCTNFGVTSASMVSIAPKSAPTSITRRIPPSAFQSGSLRDLA